MWVKRYSGVCVYFRYDCSIGEQRYTEEECELIARRAVREALGCVFAAGKIESVCIGEVGGAFTFRLGAEELSEERVIVRVRSDTGSVILYDATGCEGIVGDGR